MTAKLVWIDRHHPAARPCAGAPRGRRASATRLRSGRPAHRCGPSSCRAGSRRPTATPGRGSRCRRASPGSTWRSGGAARRPAASAARTPGSAQTQTARAPSSATIMPTIVASTVVTFETIEVAVLVTTLCTPPMSFEMRDWISPVRVRVKNASDRRCRWRKTAARRSCITRWPTWFESSVCHTPRTPVTIAIAIIPRRGRATARRVVALDRLQDAAQQEGGHDAESGRDEDQPQDHAEPAAIVAEEPRDALQVRPADRRVGRALGRLSGPRWKPREHAATVENAARLVPCAGSASSVVRRADGCRRTPRRRVHSGLQLLRAGSGSSTAAGVSG